MLQRSLQSGLDVSHLIKARELQQGGEVQGVNLDVVLEVFFEEFTEALLLTVGGVRRVFQDELASRFEQVVDFAEESLEPCVSQGQMDPFDCVQADDRIILGFSLQVEEILIQNGYVAWEFLSDCQSHWQDFQVFFWFDDVSAACFFCRLLEIGRKLQNRQLKFLISADGAVLLTVLNQPINPLLAHGQQIPINVQGHDLLRQHPDGYFYRH